MTPVSNECATEGCANAGTERFDAGGIGSQYCPNCRAKIAALRSQSPKPSSSVREPLGHTFARIAHKAAIRIRPEVSGDAEYWRLREAITAELVDSDPPLTTTLEVPTVSPAMEQGEVERSPPGEEVERAAVNAFVKALSEPGAAAIQGQPIRIEGLNVNYVVRAALTAALSAQERG